MQDNTNKFQVTWSEAERFSKDGVTVIVNRSSHERRPYYSYEIQFESMKGAMVRHRSVPRTGQGKVTITACAETVTELVTEAEAFIAKAYQDNEDAYIGEREERERTQLDKGKPKQIGGTHRKVAT